MALKSILTTQEAFEALDEAQQAEYQKAADGTWVLKVDNLDDHPQVKGLVATLAKFREVFPDAKAAKALKDRLDAMEQAWDGMDPEETRSRLERLEEYEAGGKPDVKTRIEAAKEEVRRAYERELETRDSRVSELEAAIGERDAFVERLTVDRHLDEALAEGKTIEGLRKGAKAYLKITHKPQVERVVDEDTGEAAYRGVIKTPLGESTIKDFVAQWLTTDEAQEYLPPSGNAGTGSKSGGVGGIRRTNPFAKDTRNDTEASRMIKENPALAKQMADAAGVTLNL